MSLVTDAVQPSIVSHLIAATRCPPMTLADLVVAQAAGYDLAYLEVDKAVTLDFREPQHVTTALASDCGRFSSAAFQTVSALGNSMETRDGFPWSLIKMYYAAFYASHALLRSFGEGCSFFYRQHTEHLAHLSAALGLDPSFRVDSGLYHCVLNQGATVVSYRKAQGQAGGAHEAFWMVFGKKLRSVAEGVLHGRLPTADAQLVYSKLDELLQVLDRKGGFSWLSNIRNDVQYRMQHQSWFPERVRAQEREALCRLAGQWPRDPLKIDISAGRLGLLGDFVGACAFLVALCRSVIDRIGERTSRGQQSFARSGPLALLRDIGLK